MMRTKKMKVLYVSAEVSPFAKTGGLADVAGSLPGSLAGNGLDVRIAMPRYKPINANMKYKADFPVLIWDNKETCIVREGKISYKEEGMPDSVPVYFIDNYRYFDRDGIYCFFDDGDRFAFFCKAVLEMLPHIGFKPDIIHCNDWHTGPICMLLKEGYKSNPFYNGISTVFTIHNLQYQGNFPGNFFNIFNLGQEVFTQEKAEFYGAFSFMKTGIVYADKVNTVSKKYAEEIQTSQYGEKMEGILRSRKADLSGILNGISYQYFNPETDNVIVKNYSSKNFENKKENKSALQKELGLPVKDVPVLAIISRLSGQKGLDLVIDISNELLKKDVQLIILGTGESFYEEEFRKIKKDYPDKLGLHIGFDAILAQKIYAGSDMFLMPSRFEPCGLGQIISLRYGSVPIVRATGGLAETIIDYDSDKQNGNGFSFKDFNAESLMKTISRAINTYENQDEWRKLVKLALECDFSWQRSAKKYIDLYVKAMN